MSHFRSLANSEQCDNERAVLPTGQNHSVPPVGCFCGTKAGCDMPARSLN